MRSTADALRHLLLAALATLTPLVAHAQAKTMDVTQIEDVPLEDLLATETTVASTRSVQQRASPGVVTVITREEIRRIGARDLMEVLVLVPGFDVGSDVNGTVGVVFRGNWGNEGKVLFLVDGVDMNELGYLTMPLFAHIPLDDVDRVEVLRGPGSARYGNTAEMAVVHVITRSGLSRREASVELNAGRAAQAFENQSVALNVDTPIDAVPGLSLGLNVHAGTRAMSDRDYTDLAGNTVSLAWQNRSTTYWVAGHAAYRGIEAHLLVDEHEVFDRTGYGDATLHATAVKTSFPSGALSLQVPLLHIDRVQLDAHLMLQHQLPWWSLVDDGVLTEPLRLIADRARFNATMSWVVLPTLRIESGVEATADAFREVAQRSRPWFDDVIDTHVFGDDVTHYANAALFGEAQVDNPLFTLTVGARGELHSAAGPSFVPRVVLTRVFDRGHAKLLASGAFKAPSQYNFATTPEIRPERTRVLEGEIGVQLLDALYLTTNFFDILQYDTIVFVVDGNTGGYANYSNTGTRGVELQALWTSSFAKIDASWAYATSEGINEVDLYTTPTASDRMIGMAGHRVVVRGALFLAPHVTVSPTLLLRSARASAVGLDETGATIFADLPPSALLHVFVDVPDLVPGVEFGIGVRNVLDEKFVLPQPFDGGRPAMPFEDREFVVRMTGRMPL